MHHIIYKAETGAGQAVLHGRDPGVRRGFPGDAEPYGVQQGSAGRRKGVSGKGSQGSPENSRQDDEGTGRDPCGDGGIGGRNGTDRNG